MRLIRLLVMTTVLSAPLFVNPAAAQDVSRAPAPSAEQSPAGGDIIVTATRREERLQDVPISVTAFSGETLANRQVTDVTNLARMTPAMQVKPTFTPLEITVSIRGVTQIIPSLNSDPPIGTYVDGVYNAINAGSNSALIDMERVEVLKGPQGTLFGRNTIGGAISIITAKPRDEFGGSVEAKYGNYQAFTGTGVLNLPIQPGVLAARFVYQHGEHAGYGTNLTTGNPTNSFNQEYGRASLRFTPSSDWEVLASGYLVKAHGYGPPTKPGFVDTTARIAPVLPPTNVFIPALSGRPGDTLANYVGRGGDQDTFGNIDNRFSLEQYGGSLSVLHEMSDAVSLKAIGGYIHTDYNAITSLSGTPYVLINLLGQPLKADQYTIEAQAFGKAMDGRLDWITGLYYFNGKGSQVATSIALPTIATLFGQPVTQGVRNPNVNNSSYSAYAQATFEVMPKVRLTAGVRYVIDTRKVVYSDYSTTAGSLPGTYIACALANAPFDPDRADCFYRRSKRYEYVPWTAGVDYKPNDDLLVYAKISKGYRSGAFTLGGPAAVAPSVTVTQAQAAQQTAINLATFAPAEPENLLSPEVGFKLEAFDRRLRLNAASYYSWYKNVQVAVNGTAACTTCTPPSLLVNSGKVEIWGGEVEAGLLLGALRIDGVAAVTRPRYVSGPFVGLPVLNVSKFNAAVTGTYTAELNDAQLTLSATYSYRSNAYLGARAPTRPQAWNDSLQQPGFGLLDARIGLAIADTPISFALYAQNLTNKQYITAAAQFAPPLGYTIQWPGIPRTYGGSVKLTF